MSCLIADRYSEKQKTVLVTPGAAFSQTTSVDSVVHPRHRSTPTEYRYRSPPPGYRRRVVAVVVAIVAAAATIAAAHPAPTHLPSASSTFSTYYTSTLPSPTSLLTRTRTLTTSRVTCETVVGQCASAVFQVLVERFQRRIIKY